MDTELGNNLQKTHNFMLLNPLFHEFYFTFIVYRLIDAALIGNFFHDPFSFQN